MSTLPSDRFDQTRFYHPQPGQPGRSYTFAAGTIGDISGFDADFFGISAREASQIDPQQRLLLELTWEAFERAGQIPGRLAGSRCAVYVGISGSDYAERRMGDLESTESYFMLGATLSIAANRISYVFDLKGPSIAVDTACSSSLVALHEAVQAIRGGRASMAVVAGVNLLVSPAPFVGFAAASMLSQSGRCRAFAKGADGYVRAEGAGVIILKPLADAERDGDPILAIVRGVGVNSDGRTHGIAMPSSQAQETLLREVYRDARVAPQSLSYFEAHGTGTPIGDPIEASAIGRALGIRRSRTSPLPIGSVKSNIGHLEPAAGIAGTIKAIEILRHGRIPPSLHLEDLNPEIGFGELNLAPVAEAQNLPDPAHAIIGINSFGFGGTNAHAVLEAYRGATRPSALPSHRPLLPLVVSARSEAALVAAAAELRGFLEAGPAVSWSDIAYTACCRRTHHEHRLILRADSSERAAELLREFEAESHTGYHAGASVARRPKTAFVFVGNGSQWQGMGVRLLAEDPVFRETVTRIDAVARWRLGWSILQMIGSDSAPIDDTRFAQPLLFAFQIGVVESLRARGLVPDAVVGHSVGEVSAAYVSGALSLEHAVHLVKERSEAQGRTRGQGRMLAVSVDAATAAAEIEGLGGAVELAAVNSPRAVTLAGDENVLRELHAVFDARGVASRMLDLDYAFHSRTQDVAREQALRAFAFLAPVQSRIPFYSTVTGGQIEGGLLNGNYWWRNIRERVHFAEAISLLAADGHQVFLEIGPQPQLQGYIRHTLSETKRLGQPLATLSRSDSGSSALERAADRAFVAGSNLSFDPSFPQGGNVVLLPTYPWQRERHWHVPTPEAAQSFLSRSDGALLGVRAAPGIATWERQFDVAQLPFLADHVVDGSVVVPAAVFIEMAFEAARLLFPAKGGEIEAMEIHRPLVAEPGHSHVVRFHWSAADSIFRIESRPHMRDSGWHIHVTGRLTPATGPVQPERTAATLGESITITDEEHYRFARSRGFAYGPAFRVLREAVTDGTTVLAELELEEDTSGSEWCVPPALLDGALQAVFPALRLQDNADEADAVFLPHKFARIVLYAPAGKFARAEIVIRDGNRRRVLADCIIRNDHGTIVAELQGVRLTAVRLGAQGSARASSHETVFHPLASRHETFASKVPSQSARQSLQDGVQPGAVSELRKRMDELAGAVAADTLIALGSASVPAEKEDILARLIALIDQHPEPVADWDVLWAAAIRRHPAMLAELVLLARAARHLPSLLQGDAEFDPPGQGLLDHLFDTAPLFAPANDALARAFERFASAWPDRRELRVLLVIGGAGSIGHRLINALPAGRCDITIVDTTESRAGWLTDEQTQRNDIHVVDVELHEPDGFPQSQFDIVVDAYGLQASTDPFQILQNLAVWTAPDGMLLMAECAPSAWAEIAFSTTGADAAHRTDLNTLLQESGFRDVQEWEMGGARLLCASASPVVHAASHPEEAQWIVFAAPGESDLAAMLCDVLARNGQRSLRLDVSPTRDWCNEQDWERFWRSVAAREGVPAGFIHLAGLASNPHTASEQMALQDVRCLTLLAAVKALRRVAPTAKLALRLITDGAFARRPAQAPLVGLARVIQNEYPDFSCRVIDLDRGGSGLERFAGELADEIVVSSAENEVLLEAGSRHAPRLRKVEPRRDRLGDDELEFLQSPGGSLDNLQWVRAPRAALEPDQIEIAVEAAGLNFRDVMFAMGALPDDLLEGGFAGATLGMEAAGIVARVGANIDDLCIGEKVVCFAPATIASHTVTSRFAAAPLPEGLDFAEGATLIAAFFTVTYALKHLAHLSRGERILIHGAAGGVGMAAIQYARHCGAEIFATAGTEDKRAVVSLLGVDADHVFDSRSNDFAQRIMTCTGGEGVDVVLNSIAGEAVHHGLTALRPFGRFIELGKADFVANSRIGLRVFRNNIAYFGVDSDQLMARRTQLSAEVFEDTIALFREGAYAPLPYRRYGREQIVDAFRHMQRSRHMGKIVIAPQEHYLPASSPATRKIAIQPDGIYAITGGLGGIGLALAQWLAARGARHIALVGRNGTPDGDATATITALRAAGVTVHAHACDVRDEAAVKSLVDSWGGALRGIMHAAAVFDDALLAEQSAERFRAVLAPKVAGGWALHAATRHLDLDIFLCFSSISAAIGNPGQANYVAANLFLESLVALRRSEGLAAQLAALGPVADAGYLTRHKELVQSFDKMGMRPLSTQDVFAWLDRTVLGGERGELLADVKWTRLRALLPAVKSPRFSRLFGQGKEEEDIIGESDIAQLVKTLPPGEVLELLTGAVTQLVAQILHLPPEKIDRERSVFELGMDSLMGLELRMSIEERIGVGISPMLLSQDIGVARIAEAIRDQLLGVAPAQPENARPDPVSAERDYLLARHGESIDAALIDEALAAVERARPGRKSP